MRRWLPAAGISGLFFLAGIAGFPGAAAAAADPAPVSPAKAAPAKTAPAAPAAAPSAAEPPAPAATTAAPAAKAQPAKTQPTKPQTATPAKARARSEAGTAARSQAAPGTSRSATANVKATRAEARRAAAAAAEQPASPASTTPTKAERAKAAAKAKAEAAAEAAATDVAPAAEAAAAPVTAASNHVTAICHATGSATAPFELIEIATPAVPAHLGHGDRLPVGGTCPGPAPPPPAPDVLVCHATGSATTPFELINIPAAALPAHLGHGDRLPTGGTCPGPTPPPPSPDVSICHATGAPATPFQLINIPAAALPAHLAHGDRLPVGGACPSGTGTPPPAADVVICHATGSATTPFELLTIPAAALPAHLAHGDRLPANGACPGATQPPAAPDVVICHATGSAANPFVLLTVPFAALPAHLGHGDRLPTGGACPGAGVTPPAPDVVICHATGSATNPFVLLSVPSAALPAHLGHGDRLPTGGACPGAPPRAPDEVLSDDDERDDDDDEVATVVATRPPTVEAQFVSVPILVNLDGLSSLPATGFDAGLAALIGLLLLVAGAGLTRAASARATARRISGGSRPGHGRPPRSGSARATARTTIVGSSRRRGHGRHRRAGRLSILQARVLALALVITSRFRVPGLLQPDPQPRRAG